MIRNTPYGKRIQSKIQRETSDHMSRGAYHHQALVPGGGGHFYNMPPPPHQFLQHPGHGHHMSMGQGSDFSRSPYLGGYGNQPPPHHLQMHQQQQLQQQHQQQQHHLGPQQPQHYQQHRQNESIGGAGGNNGFAPFPMGGGQPMPDYQSNGFY